MEFEVPAALQLPGHHSELVDVWRAHVLLLALLVYVYFETPGVKLNLEQHALSTAQSNWNPLRFLEPAIFHV